MSDSPRTRGKGSGALPMVETRAKYTQLMRQGISNAEACRTLKINRRTGMRWRHGRTVTNAQGHPKTYAPIALKEPPTISSRYLSEVERIQIADELQLGKRLRQIAAELGRSPSTVSASRASSRSSSSMVRSPSAATTSRRPRPARATRSTVICGPSPPTAGSRACWVARSRCAPCSTPSSASRARKRRC